MAYCRFDENDVYLYASVKGYFVCCGCRLNRCLDVNLRTRTKTLAHLAEHDTAGHTFPRNVVAILKHERRVCGEHTERLTDD
jgi:hypothetical protein